MGRTRLRLFAAFGGAAVLVGVAACAARVDDGTKKPDVSAKAVSPESAAHLRGPVQAVLETARTQGNLSVAQRRSLDTIEKELQQDQGGRTELRKKLRASAAAVVRSGTADSTEFDRSVTQAVSAVEQHVNENASALEEIHGILKPDQRAAVAAALRARIEERFGRRDDPRQRRHQAFQRLASYLMLSPAQIDELKAARKDLVGERKELHPSREELLGLVDAFEGENFSAALDTFRAKKLAILRQRVARAGERTDTVLALFTPEQRDLLADLILKGPRQVLLGEPDDQARVQAPAAPAQPAP